MFLEAFHIQFISIIGWAFHRSWCRKACRLPSPFAEGFLAYLGGVLAGPVAYLIIDRIVMRSREAYFFPRLGYLLGVGRLRFGFVVSFLDPSDVEAGASSERIGHINRK